MTVDESSSSVPENLDWRHHYKDNKAIFDYLKFSTPSKSQRRAGHASSLPGRRFHEDSDEQATPPLSRANVDGPKTRTKADIVRETNYARKRESGKDDSSWACDCCPAGAVFQNLFATKATLEP